jgi:hypothetical protein
VFVTAEKYTQENQSVMEWWIHILQKVNVQVGEYTRAMDTARTQKRQVFAFIRTSRIYDPIWMHRTHAYP